MDGFTDAKIKKFGEEFIGVIRLLCPPAEIKSIKDILTEHAMEGIKFTTTTEITYNMYKNGLSIENIAMER